MIALTEIPKPCGSAEKGRPTSMLLVSNACNTAEGGWQSARRGRQPQGCGGNGQPRCRPALVAHLADDVSVEAAQPAWTASPRSRVTPGCVPLPTGGPQWPSSPVGPHAENGRIRMDFVESPTAAADAATDPPYGEPGDEETDCRPCPLIAGHA